MCDKSDVDNLKAVGTKLRIIRTFVRISVVESWHGLNWLKVNIL
jgi:hypothetical protein